MTLTKISSPFEDDNMNDEMMNFSLLIEEIVYMKDVSYMDAIVLYCEETGMEVEVAAKLISPSIKNKIKEEAENLHFLPKNQSLKLPF